MESEGEDVSLASSFRALRTQGRIEATIHTQKTPGVSPSHRGSRITHRRKVIAPVSDFAQANHLPFIVRMLACPDQGASAGDHGQCQAHYFLISNSHSGPNRRRGGFAPRFIIHRLLRRRAKAHLHQRRARGVGKEGLSVWCRSRCRRCIRSRDRRSCQARGQGSDRGACK
jgi:hypothetical protein